MKEFIKKPIVIFGIITFIILIAFVVGRKIAAKKSPKTQNPNP